MSEDKTPLGMRAFLKKTAPDIKKAIDDDKIASKTVLKKLLTLYKNYI